MPNRYVAKPLPFAGAVIVDTETGEGAGVFGPISNADSFRMAGDGARWLNRGATDMGFEFTRENLTWQPREDYEHLLEATA